jgi:replicative DNA helicase
VSVAEVTQRGGEFERMPPHDVAAEQCVLGGMLLSKDAISDVIEVIRPADHYRPAHQLLHEAILDLYARGEPADPITVANELTRRGELARIGGAPYLHTLIASVPTAANAGYYARIVRERAILRRLVEAGTRIVQFGYAGDGDADELVDRAQAEVFSVTDRRIAEDYHSLSEIMPGALEEIEAIGAHGGGITGVPTGFADLDALTNGLHPGQMVVVAARPAVGKALALDTPLATPRGWTTMGQVRAGDLLIGADGRPIRVLAATEVMHGRPCYQVEFSDGEAIVADDGHQWLTWTSHAAGFVPPQVVTTGEMAAALRTPAPGCRSRYAVAMPRPLELPQADLPVPPYALGAALAGRASAGRVAAGRFAAGSVPTAHSGPLEHADCAFGTPVDGRIPREYLRASSAQRRELLAGLLGVERLTGPARITLPSEALAADVRELIHSLGFQSTTVRSPRRHVIRFTDELPWRYVVAVKPVPSVPVRCVQVDSADRLYLAGRAMIPTHNSALALDFARSATIRHQLPTVIFSLEMGRNEITMRLLSAEARVPMHVMRTGQMSDDDWARLARRMSEVADAPLFIDDSPNMSLMEIRAKCRRLKQRHDLKLVIIDYLQLMSSPRRVENRQQEVSEMSRSLKLLAKELDVPVVALSQLNRGPEQRQDKKPMLSDLRESGCMTADTELLRADTGAPVTFGELMRDGWDGVLVWSVDDKHRMVPAPITNVFSSGTKEVFRLRLASGREVKATASHPFLTFAGWTRLGELRPGDRLGIPRAIPQPVTGGLGWSEYRIGLLAHLLGDGCVLRRQPVHYTSNDPANLAFVEAAAATEFGITARRVAQRTWWHTYLPAPHHCTHGRGNPIHSWFRELGIEDRGARTTNTNVDTLPINVWQVVKAERARAGLTEREFQAAIGTSYCGTTLYKSCPSRERLTRCGNVLGSQLLRDIASSDLFWDRVVSIEPLGPQPVFDATVKETHNFVANGIIAHNSIEQDSDVVILLHREDAYERESPRAGEADLIVAKHRNGPTATVTVAFQGHYSRFVDMAPG